MWFVIELHYLQANHVFQNQLTANKNNMISLSTYCHLVYFSLNKKVLKTCIKMGYLVTHLHSDLETGVWCLAWDVLMVAEHQITDSYGTLT